MYKQIAPILGTLVFALLLLSSCVPASSLVSRAPTPTSVPGTELPFEVLMNAEFSAYTGSEPALFLVTSSTDAQAVSANLIEGYSEEFAQQARQLEPGQVLVVLLREPHPHGGYQILTSRIVLQGDELYVYAELCKPSAGVAAETQYFQVVQTTLPPEVAVTNLKPVLVAYPVNC